MSKQQEVALGASNDPQITANFGVYDDAKIQQFIQEKGLAMAKVSHWSELDYHFKVLDSPVVNAFALPGGYVYFTRGILAHFNNEAEFAGVLGHEIGHVTARHSAQQYTKQTLAQVGLIAGMIASPEFAQFGQQAMQGMQLLFLKFSRDHESQSDELGVEYSTRVGYDAKCMASFFGTLDRLSGGSDKRLPEFMSTHPDPANREVRVGELANLWQNKDPRNNYAVNRDQYLRLIDGIIYGEDPKQGFEENGTFYHPVLKFQFPVPNSWRLANSPQQVQMAPKDGKAMMLLTLSQEKTLQAAANALAEKYKLQIASSSPRTVNGISAYEVISQQTNQKTGQVIRVITYLYQYGDLIYEMHGMTDANSFGSYRNLFERTQRGFASLNDPDKINRKPERIAIKTVPSTQTLRQALSSFGMSSDRHEELAILNGMQLTDQVKAGMLIKTVTR